MDDKLKEFLEKHLAALPPVVQRAITSADIEKHLRKLAGTHKLHVDQWQRLENEVLLTLLGAQPIEKLQANIEKEVGTTPEVAAALVDSIMDVVFEPIREELERELGHPAAQDEKISIIEKMRDEVLAEASPTPVAAVPQPTPPTIPSTPPAAPPSQKIERGPASGAYIPGETSVARTNITDDPYREPPK